MIKSLLKEDEQHQVNVLNACVARLAKEIKEATNARKKDKDGYIKTSQLISMRVSATHLLKDIAELEAIANATMQRAVDLDKRVRPHLYPAE